LITSGRGGKKGPGCLGWSAIRRRELKGDQSKGRKGAGTLVFLQMTGGTQKGEQLIGGRPKKKKKKERGATVLFSRRIKGKGKKTKGEKSGGQTSTREKAPFRDGGTAMEENK